MNNTQFDAQLTIPLNEHSSFSLAYLGDAFFELWCRQKILQRLQNRRLVHRHVVQWVRCQTQAQLAQLILPLLKIEEEKFTARDVTAKLFLRPNMQQSKITERQPDLNVWWATGIWKNRQIVLKS